MTARRPRRSRRALPRRGRRRARRACSTRGRSTRARSSRRVLRRAARRARRPRLRRAPRSRRARRSRSSIASSTRARAAAGRGARAGRRRVARRCRSSRPFGARRSARPATSSASRARPARPRRRICWRPRSRRSAATRTRRRTTTSSGCRSRCCNAPAAARVVVAEMGERFPGDIALLCAIARPQSRCRHQCRASRTPSTSAAPTARPRRWASCSKRCPPDGLAVLNADDDWTPKLRARRRRAGRDRRSSPGADYAIAHVELDDELRPSFSLQREPRFAVPLHGEHQVANAALAVGGCATAVFAMPISTRSRPSWRRRRPAAGGSS